MSWYRTGTINLTKDSANVTGVNTKWAQAVNGVMSGMMVIMPDGKLYEIKNVVSDTSLVLVTAYAGATAAGQAYAVVTTYEGDLSQFSARFSALLTALGGSRADLYNWLTSTAATITISKDDGTTLSVKTLKAFSDEQATFAKKGKNSDITELTGLTKPLSMAQGGTGATDAAGIRQNAGLGTAATRDVGTDTGNVMQVGAFGLGVASGRPTSNAELTSVSGWPASFFTQGGAGVSNLFGIHGVGINLPYALENSTRMGGIIYLNRRGLIQTRWQSVDIDSGAVNVDVCTFYGTSNTTKASDGTLKSASPVIQLFNDGKYSTNAESEGCSVSRIAIGEYLIEGCLGMNADASWGGIDGGFDIPKDRNGQPLIWLDFRVNADGSILVKTYHRTYPNSPTFAQNNIEGVKDGDPVDIPADQFVSVRVEMPVDSLWNQQQVIAQAQSEEAEQASQA